MPVRARVPGSIDDQVYDPRVLLVIGLSIAIAHADDGRAPAQTDAWVDAQIAEANRLFAPAGVAFRWTTTRTASEHAVHVETRADRDAIGDGPGALDAGVVNVTIAGSLRDVDEPGRMRMGVCWQRSDDASRRYVILSASAKPMVLAHELGHFFGNGHTQVPNNLMSYVHPDPSLTAFDEAQLARVRARANAAVAAGLLVDELPARRLP